MKKSFQHLLFGCLCAALLAANNVGAQPTTTKVKDAKPAAAEVKTKDAEVPKPYPFSGTVTNIDKSAKTISLTKKDGVRVLHTDAETTFEMDGHAAKFADIKVGYYVSGRIHPRASKDENEVILKGVIHKEAPLHTRATERMQNEKPAVTPAPATESTATNAPAKKKKKTTAQ